MTRPTLTDSKPNEHNQGLLFMVNLDRCDESCITLDDLSSRVCVPNKTEDVNLNAFNMITRINE